MPDVSYHTGSCRRGAVRFEASAEPHHVSYCHCGDCRKATGAPVSAFVGFAADKVSLTGEALKSFDRHCMPMCASNCPMCTCRTGCRGI